MGRISSRRESGGRDVPLVINSKGKNMERSRTEKSDGGWWGVGPVAGLVGGDAEAGWAVEGLRIAKEQGLLGASGGAP